MEKYNDQDRNMIATISNLSESTFAIIFIILS